MLVAVGVPGALLPVAMGFLVVAAVMARAARTEIWAREAIVDFWAMTLLMVGTLAAPSAQGIADTASAGATSASASTVAHPSSELLALHHGGAPTNALEFVTSPTVVLIAWLLARAAFAVTARRTASIRHSLLTAAAAAAQLLVMLAVH
ncbi:hypothetical protein N1027_11940 [Herbiconiux sp. CPCC 205763]|uniref:DUF5134 domain-containing protein n=1 Tax=Herbiconiux aconitum TaxID=2970913 RepID=A0ABT2GVD1_9MICO|nr:hypothetical protein [Herbiconiux aconitum]MCS5718846.1 hypothetical protein [Herbiconiux aconitum]